MWTIAVDGVNPERARYKSTHRKRGDGTGATALFKWIQTRSLAQSAGFLRCRSVRTGQERSG